MFMLPAGCRQALSAMPLLMKGRKCTRYTRLIAILLLCIVIVMYVWGWQKLWGGQWLGDRSNIALTYGNGDWNMGSANRASLNQLSKKDNYEDLQDNGQYFGHNLHVKYKVVENSAEIPGDSRTFTKGEVTLTNRGKRDFPNTGWQIIFTHIRNVLPTEENILIYNNTRNDCIVHIKHWNGMLFIVEPAEKFKAIRPGENATFPIFTFCCSLNRVDILPNWYIVFQGIEPSILWSTYSESEKFVAPFDSPRSWKYNSNPQSSQFDLHNPPTVQDRYHNDGVKDLGKAPIPVIPTPVMVPVFNESATVTISSFQVMKAEPLFESAIQELKRQWYWAFEETDSPPKTPYIKFMKEEVKVTSRDTVLPTDETYELSVNATTRIITIKASGAAGAFYAVQSLLSICHYKDVVEVPEVLIRDGPRYSYRGLMIDVARNFHNKETIMRYIDAMAMYKLNKLHLHLTDDEGWRLEIPGLEELTEVSAKRCHDPTETKCLLPFLASGPDSSAPTSGFFSVEDYRDILRYAVAHHVEVIPEFDMPGHGHAAIKAMYLRYMKWKAKNETEARRYLLSDLDDASEYISVQSVKDGAINPCTGSTYRFIKKVLDAVVAMHKDISPLRVFHFGGDEVPPNAWTKSPLCLKLTDSGKMPKELFLSNVADIASLYGLELAAWEDGVIVQGEPMDRNKLRQKNVYVYIWNNVGPLANRAYTLASLGYKVVLTPATNMYLDHPYEPDPEERGLIWATRFVDCKRIFQLMPENVYASVDTDMLGHPIPDCITTECPDQVPLQNKQSIAGIQGSLFGELLRTEKIMDYMLFPRLLALAERAWHAASWEYEPDKQKRKDAMKQDWINFANSLGHKELFRLDNRKFEYRVPPPGAVVNNGTLSILVAFPGHMVVEMSTDGGKNWHRVDSGTKVQKEQKVLLHSRTLTSIARFSRDVHL